MNIPLAYDSPQHIAQFLEASSIAPRKRWGQNFLINHGAKEKIIQLLQLNNETHLLEIGPGLGAMTYLALQLNPRFLGVFEIDPAYQVILNDFFGSYQQFHIIKGDVLKTWPAFIAENPEQRFTVLGNLPYNISSAIIQQLAYSPIDRAVLTIQKELGERLMAKPKTKNYSSLSVWAQANFRIQSHGHLKAGSFYPPPKVDSSIISLTPDQQLTYETLPVLDHILKLAFAHRRKILRHNWNTLISGALSTLSQDVLNTYIDEEIYQIRAEELPVSYYVQLTKNLYQYI